MRLAGVENVLSKLCDDGFSMVMSFASEQNILQDRDLKN
jgi:hypothetical protein